MGGAAAYHLSARGQRVLGLERFGPAHDKGSSHGDSRVTRQAYFEDPAYVPLLLRAHELWSALVRDSGRDVITLTGGLMIGPPTSTTVAGSRRSAEQWGLPHEILGAADVRHRFPTLRPAADDIALYEANAGFVRIHRSYLVALPLVSELRMTANGYAVVIGTGDGAKELPVSRRHTKELKERIVRPPKSGW